MKFCGHCGASLQDGTKFCPECGKETQQTNVAQTTPPTQPEQPTQPTYHVNTPFFKMSLRVPDGNSSVASKSPLAFLLGLIAAVIGLFSGQITAYYSILVLFGSLLCLKDVFVIFGSIIELLVALLLVFFIIPIFGGAASIIMVILLVLGGICGLLPYVLSKL